MKIEGGETRMKTDLEGLQAAQHKVGILLGAGDGGKEKGGGKIT